ncbi:hypothetical protein ACSSVY_004547 [Roseovarius sp. MBR-51]
MSSVPNLVLVFARCSAKIKDKEELPETLRQNLLSR